MSDLYRDMDDKAIADMLDEAIARLERRGQYFIAAQISSALDSFLALSSGLVRSSLADDWESS